jgi:hypothetical protein
MDRRVAAPLSVWREPHRFPLSRPWKKMLRKNGMPGMEAIFTAIYRSASGVRRTPERMRAAVRNFNRNLPASLRDGDEQRENRIESGEGPRSLAEGFEIHEFDV